MYAIGDVLQSTFAVLATTATEVGEPAAGNGWKEAVGKVIPVVKDALKQLGELLWNFGLWAKETAQFYWPAVVTWVSGNPELSGGIGIGLGIALAIYILNVCCCSKNEAPTSRA